MKKHLFYLLSILICLNLTGCKDDANDPVKEPSEEAKKLGFKEIAVNLDANSNEICYFVYENGDSLTLIGNKDKDGRATDLYLMNYVYENKKFSTRFDDSMRPEVITFEDNVEITFDWISDREAVVMAFDSESNNYITTVWNMDNANSWKTNRVKSSKRDGKLKLEINESDSNMPTRATAVEDLNDQYAVFSVTQCASPKDLSTWIGLVNSKTKKFIENLYYYKKISTGKYLYLIPAGSYPAAATNQELCQNIDNWILTPLKEGLTYLAGFSSVADVIALACASTGIGVPPAAVLEALTVATVVGAATLEVFLAANGTQGLMSTLNPDWYYKEYVTADLILSPHIITPDAVIDCPRQTINPESMGIEINYDIDGDPTIDSFELNPSYPAQFEDYVASASFHCVPIGSFITVSIVGTDGYTDSITTTANSSSGTATLWVPGAETGVYDVCTIEITTPDGSITTRMTASLVFGY